nr:shikimate kinase [Tissierella sp.]
MKKLIDYNIVFIGFIGVGKTTIADLLAKRLLLKVIDTDKKIEEKFKKTVSEIFSNSGENKFRELESGIIKDLEDERGIIISCGGGVCLRDENISSLRKNGRLVLLEAAPDIIFNRLKNEAGRPILNGKVDILSISDFINERKESYHKSADIIIDIEGKTSEDIIDEIIGKLNIS